MTNMVIHKGSTSENDGFGRLYPLVRELEKDGLLRIIHSDSDKIVTQCTPGAAEQLQKGCSTLVVPYRFDAIRPCRYLKNAYEYED